MLRPGGEAWHSVTARERRRQILAEAVRAVAPKLAGTHARANRQEWAASRLAEGWSRRTVQDAIGAGSLTMVRARIGEVNGAAPALPDRLARAMRAVGIIDVQRLSETRRGHDLTPHRPTAVPPRVRSAD